MAARLHLSENELLDAARALVHALEHLDMLEEWQESTAQDELDLTTAINLTDSKIKRYREWEYGNGSSNKGVFE